MNMDCRMTRQFMDDLESNIGFLMIYFGLLEQIKANREVGRSMELENSCQFIREEQYRLLRETQLDLYLPGLPSREGYSSDFHTLNFSPRNASIQDDISRQVVDQTIEVLEALRRDLENRADALLAVLDHTPKPVPEFIFNLHTSHRGYSLLLRNWINNLEERVPRPRSSDHQLPASYSEHRACESLGLSKVDVEGEAENENDGAEAVYLRGAGDFEDMEPDPDMLEVIREYFPELVAIPAIAMSFRKCFQLREEGEDPDNTTDAKIEVRLQLMEFLDYIDAHGTSLSNFEVREFRDSLVQALPLRESEDKSIVNLHASLLQHLEQKRDELARPLMAIDSLVEMLQTARPDLEDMGDDA